MFVYQLQVNYTFSLFLFWGMFWPNFFAFDIQLITFLPCLIKNKNSLCAPPPRLRCCCGNNRCHVSATRYNPLKKKNTKRELKSYSHSPKNVKGVKTPRRSPNVSHDKSSHAHGTTGARSLQCRAGRLRATAAGQRPTTVEEERVLAPGFGNDKCGERTGVWAGLCVGRRGFV